jgi:hypothetical protein
VAVDRDGRRSLCIGLSSRDAPIEPPDVRFLEKRQHDDRSLNAACIRLLALAYPAITKSRPKNASTLIHTEGFWLKVRLPNFSSSLKRKRLNECGLGRSSAACAAHRTRRRALEHSADYAARSADCGSGSSRTLRIMPSALCFCGRLFSGPWFRSGLDYCASSK